MSTPSINLPLNGPVIGIGVDIIEIERVEAIYERQGERFLARVYTSQEREYCLKHKKPGARLAARFAAKEAVSKAFSTGISEHLNFTSIEVVVGERGQPLVRLDERGEKLLQEVGGSGVAISLSHSDVQAVAFAAIIGKSRD